MGWWNRTILGGDEPLDFIITIEKRLKIPDLYPIGSWSKSKQRLVRSAIEELGDKWVEWIQEIKIDVEIQTAYVVWIASGAYMSDDWKQIGIKAGLKDSWALSGDSERKVRINEYINALKGYDGTPILISD